MPATRTAAQQAASRANGARSRGPVSEAGKARSARNGTQHGLRGGPFALLPGEDREEFAALHAAVAADWGPRDAYERRWVMELVTSHVAPGPAARPGAGDLTARPRRARPPRRR